MSYMYKSTKTYEHIASCCFRQWKAKSHCSLLHGYALTFKFVFGSNKLDKNNWVVDFGGLKPLKERLEYWFDHTLVVSHNDPLLPFLIEHRDRGLYDLRAMEATGCEAFAKFAYELAEPVIAEYFPHATLISCEVMEHGANSAIYSRG